MNWVQGESGVIVPPNGYLKQLVKFVKTLMSFLIFDEVQTGLDTGEMFASQTFGVTPGINSLAKAIAGGFPMGAVLANDNAAESSCLETMLQHFGGNHSGCAAAKSIYQFYFRRKNCWINPKKMVHTSLKNFKCVKET